MALVGLRDRIASFTEDDRGVTDWLRRPAVIRATGRLRAMRSEDERTDDDQSKRQFHRSDAAGALDVGTLNAA
jgi:hypothetical protein